MSVIEGMHDNYNNKYFIKTRFLLNGFSFLHVKFKINCRLEAFHLVLGITYHNPIGCHDLVIY